MPKSEQSAPAVEAVDEQAAPSNEVDLALTRDQMLGLEAVPVADAATDETDSETEDAEAGEDGEEVSAGEADAESQEEAEEAEEEETEEQEEVPADEADETEDTDDNDVSEAAPVKLSPEAIQALFKEKRELISLKGRQGKALGDKDIEIAQLNQRLARLENRDSTDEASAEADVPKTKEEWEALFATDPMRATDLYTEARERQKHQDEETRKAQEAAEIVTVTPEVGADIFIRANGIKNFDTWSDTDEGTAVLEVIGKNKRAKLAMLAAINTGDAEEVAGIMGDGLKAVRAAAINGKAKKVAQDEATKVTSAKARTLPRPGRKVNPAGAKSLMQMTPMEIANLDDKTFAKLTGGLL